MKGQLYNIEQFIVVFYILPVNYFLVKKKNKSF